MGKLVISIFLSIFVRELGGTFRGVCKLSGYLKLGGQVVMQGAALWARATKNVKKPPGEKGRTFRKEEMLHGVQWIPE